MISNRSYLILRGRLLAELEQFSFISVDDAVLLSALEMVDRRSLKAGDGLQLASAVGVRSFGQAGDLVFVAADRDLLRAADAKAS